MDLHHHDRGRGGRRGLRGRHGLLRHGPHGLRGRRGLLRHGRLGLLHHDLKVDLQNSWLQKL